MCNACTNKMLSNVSTKGTATPDCYALTRECAHVSIEIASYSHFRSIFQDTAPTNLGLIHPFIKTSDNFIGQCINAILTFAISPIGP